MRFVFLLLILGIPIADLASLIAVGGRLGVLGTLALLIAAMVIGTTLVRWQGLAVGQQARASLATGRLPVAAAFDSFCLLVAGGLFVLPGFVSDVLAALLLLPPARLGLRLLLARTAFRGEGAGPWPSGPLPGQPTTTTTGGGVILEGEVLRSEYADAPDEAGADPASRPPRRLGSGPAGRHPRPGHVRDDPPRSRRCSPRRSVLATGDHR